MVAFFSVMMVPSCGGPLRTFTTCTLQVYIRMWGVKPVVQIVSNLQFYLDGFPVHSKIRQWEGIFRLLLQCTVESVLSISCPICRLCNVQKHCFAFPGKENLGDWLQLNIVYTYIVFIMYMLCSIYLIVFAQCIYALSRNREQAIGWQLNVTFSLQQIHDGHIFTL